jgi:hypothetical protein
MSKVFVATSGLEAAPLEDGAVLYYPKSGNFIMLNQTAAHLWTTLSTPKTEEELVQSLCAVFSDVTVPTAQRDVGDFLEQLQAMELISICVVSDVNGS